MAKKKRSSSPFAKSLLKKSSLSTLIVLLALAFYQLIENQTITLPAESSSSKYANDTIRLPGTDQPLKLYSNQTKDDLTQLYVSAIGSAKESLIFVIYALLDNQIVDAINQKADAGIPVYIVCDAKASPGITRRIPKATIVRRLSDGLMHQKILIIDNQQILLGSANMTMSSLRVHGNLVIALHNPSLAKTLAEKAKSMDDEGNSSRLPHCEITMGSQNLELWVLPDDPNAVNRMIQLFRSAKKTIQVAMFTWTRLDFTQELIAAAKRGVKVEAVIDRYSSKGASAKIVQLLSHAGISVRTNTGQGLLHHKFAYIDNEILVNGSANWTNAAFKDNDDYFIVLYPLTPDQKTKMNCLSQAIRQASEKAKPKKEAKQTKVSA